MYLSLKKIILLCFLIISNSILAQKVGFEQIPLLAPLPSIIGNIDGFQNGDFKFSDIDGDNDPDLLVTGNIGRDCQNISKLYKNDGKGNFHWISNAPFINVENSALAFADVDNDNDQDVIIAGNNPLHYRTTTRLYLNDGSGNFSLSEDSTFMGVENGDLEFGDLDQDGDQDLIITGITKNENLVAKTYLNDGKGNFTEVVYPFRPVHKSSIAISDLDRDGDNDVIISGLNNLDERIVKLYSNQGGGSFVEVTNLPFMGVSAGEIKLGDVNKDDFLDLLITGWINESTTTCKLYLNNGNNSFTEVSNLPFDKVGNGSVDFADVNGDLSLDLFLSGINENEECISKLYINNGAGSFTESTSSKFIGIKNSTVQFSDIDLDKDMDILISGMDKTNPISKFYINDGNGKFSLATESPFEGVYNSAVDYADVDLDGDMDIFIIGNNHFNNSVSFLYKNDGKGNYSKSEGFSFEGAQLGAVAFSDIDNDNDPDLFYTGIGDSSNVSKLYINDGSGNFSEKKGLPFDSVGQEASAVFEDVDKDKDFDLFISGWNGSKRTTKLYLNDGSGNFSLFAGTPFENLAGTSIGFADVDGDEDKDLLITGYNDSLETVTNLYINDGTGNFAINQDSLFVKVKHGAIAFEDIDGDKDQDLLITGFIGDGKKTATLYKNDGTGKFTEVNDTPFRGVHYGSVDFSDINSDGFQDLFVTGIGATPENNHLAEFYLNDGTGKFNAGPKSKMVGVGRGAIKFLNIDGDKDEDLIITGHNGTQESAIIYRNISCNNVTGTDTRTECDSLVWIDGKTYKESNNTATFNIAGGASNGCDSLVYLNLTLLKNSKGIDAQQACKSFIWIDGNTYTQNNNTAKYRIVGGAKNGCDSIITLNLIIQNVDTSVVKNGIILAANAHKANFQWLDCNNQNMELPNETDSIFIAKLNGSYAVRITQNNCIDTSKCFSISEVGVFEDHFFKKVHLSPNPSNGKVNIDLGGMEDISLRVFNPQGKIVYQRKNIKRYHTFHLGNSPGIYFVELNSGDKRKRFKLVIQ